MNGTNPAEIRRAGKVANVLIGIGAIFIAITRMMKGLVMNF